MRVFSYVVHKEIIKKSLWNTKMEEITEHSQWGKQDSDPNKHIGDVLLLCLFCICASLLVQTLEKVCASLLWEQQQPRYNHTWLGFEALALRDERGRQKKNETERERAVKDEEF